LCSKAILETDPVDLNPILLDLKSAVHEYMKQLRKRAAAAMIGVPSSTEDRREKTI
jgi:hypothetical protein